MASRRRRNSYEESIIEEKRHMPKQKTDSQPTGSKSSSGGGDSGGSNGNPNPDPTQDSNPAPSQGSGSEGGGEPQGSTQSPFSHPRLRGKSPEEIEQFVSTMEATVREQGSTLNQLNEQMQQGQGGGQPSSDPPPEEDARPSDSEFWSNPVDTLERVVDRHLKQAIDPFKRDLMRSQEEQAWNAVRSKFSDFDQYEDLVRTLLQKNNVQQVNVAVLENLYYMARGFASAQGQNPDAGTGQDQPNAGSRGLNRGAGSGNPNPNPRPETPAAPPQHGASGHPLPSNNQPSSKTRELTESERRLAKEYGMTAEEYIAWQDAYGDEVLTMETEE